MSGSASLAAAEFGAGAVVLIVAGAVVALLGAMTFAVRWVASFPDLPPPGPQTSDLGPEPPAVANLLVNRCKVTTAAAAATLLDLAARGHLSLFEVGPDRSVVGVRRRQTEGLTEYEEQVLDLVREKATGGSAPMDAIELDAERAESWRKDFAEKVVADAKTRGLLRNRWSRNDKLFAGVLAAVSLVLLASGLYVARVESSSTNNDGLDRGDWFLVAGFTWLALMAGFAALRAVRYSSVGEAAATHWLGFKRFLRQQESFGDAPPTAVAIWDRLLAYGAAVGVARGALDGIPLEVEDPDVAWSRVGGHWRQVRVEYPTVFGYGERPLNVLGTGLVRLLFWGAIAFVALPIVIDVVWSALMDAIAGEDLGGGALGALVVGFVLVFGVMGAYLIARVADGAVRTYRGARDLRATDSVTGPVVKHHQTENRRWFAVDPGDVDEVKAFCRIGVGALPARNSMVRVVFTPRLHYIVSVEPIAAAGARGSTSRQAAP